MKGFTFIELLIVLGILVIITVVVTPFFSTSVSANDLQTSAWTLSNQLRRAQSQSMAAHGNSGWSVHIESDRHVLFKGTTYNISDPDNVETLLPAAIIISAIALNGGGSDVRFTKIRGETSDYGTITLQDTNTLNTIVLSINAFGRIQ